MAARPTCPYMFWTAVMMVYLNISTLISSSAADDASSACPKVLKGREKVSGRDRWREVKASQSVFGVRLLLGMGEAWSGAWRTGGRRK